jgi:hypothetical protein
MARAPEVQEVIADLKRLHAEVTAARVGRHRVPEKREIKRQKRLCRKAPDWGWNRAAARATLGRHNSGARDAEASYGRKLVTA